MSAGAIQSTRRGAVTDLDTGVHHCAFARAAPSAPGTSAYPAQHDAAPLSPRRSAWIGGQGTEPYVQNTQQSPCFGLSIAPQPVHT
jgi:hypothetical protein